MYSISFIKISYPERYNKTMKLLILEYDIKNLARNKTWVVHPCVNQRREKEQTTFQ